MRWPRRSQTRPDFEFGTQKTSGGMAAWLLLAVALLFSADVARSYLALRQNLSAVSARIAATPPSNLPRALQVYEPKDLDREISLARLTLQRIALPWNTLFKALGASESDGVALLSVEPDADAGVVQLTAVARDVPAMLTYLARLETNPHLSSAVVTRHEVTKTDPRLPIYFVVSAAWKRS